MEAPEIARVLEGIPNMDPAQGHEVTQFIRENRLSRCLELGFAHGVGTAYLAHAVANLEGGKVVAIDREEAHRRDPDIHAVLQRVGVPVDRVDIYFEPTSYTWRMMQFLDQGLHGFFDFIYLDGAHTWAVDGLAFYLAALLLKPGGWILFDDLDWTLATSSIASEPWVKALPLDEQETPQVRKVWDLLVRTHPSFDRLVDQGNWGYAHKASGASTHTVLVQYQHHPLIRSLRSIGSGLIRHYRGYNGAGRRAARQSR